MLDRAFALLDNRHLSRLGNLRTLINVGAAGALVLIGLILAAVQLLTKAGWVSLLFLGAGLAVAFAVAILRLQRRLAHVVPQLSLDVEGVLLGEFDDRDVVFQPTVRVRNARQDDVIVQDWAASFEMAGQTHELRHVLGQGPLHGSIDLPFLDRGGPLAPGQTPGLLQFALPGIRKQSVIEALDRNGALILRLEITDGYRRKWVAEADLRVLAADKRQEVPLPSLERIDLPLADQLAFALKQGEAIAARLDDVVPDPTAVAAAIEWHDKLYKMLTKERPDLARRLLDETDVVVGIPTIDLSSINPAHYVVADQVTWLNRIVEQLDPTPLEKWLEGRIDSAAVITRERSGPAYLKAMHEWDVQNVTELRDKWPELARPYMVLPQNPGVLDGPPSPYTAEGDAAYFGRRVDWLKATLDEKHKGTKQ